GRRAAGGPDRGARSRARADRPRGSAAAGARDGRRRRERPPRSGGCPGRAGKEPRTDRPRALAGGLGGGPGSLDRVRALLIPSSPVAGDAEGGPMSQNFKIAFTLEEGDIAYFRKLFNNARRQVDDQDTAQVISAVQALIGRVRETKKTPSFVQDAIDVLEDLI